MVAKKLGRIGEIYKDVAGEWRWTIVAQNGRKIANSGEGYKSKSWCVAMCKSCGVTETKIVPRSS